VRRLVLLLALAHLPSLGCGDGVSGPPEEVLAELDALGRGPNRAFALATALVSPGTLLLTAMDDNLLTSINLRLGTETSQCAMRTQVPGTLTVTFPGDGCALATGGITVSGTMTITIARDGSTVRILDMMDLTVDDEPITGELVVVTTDGNQFTYTTLASISGHTFNIPVLTGTSINSTTDTTANGNSPVGMTMRTLTYTGITQRFSACHAHAGSVQLVSASENIDRTITYADETPQSGNATFLDHGVSTVVTLPAIKSCPPLPMPTN
jgi:hypothetical protein